MFDYGYHFERFWKVVPKKEGKGAAYRSWQKIVAKWEGGESAFADMVVAHLIERNKFDAKWIEGKFVPQPATFLNQHRWSDEYKRVRSAPSHREFQKEEEPRVVPTDEQIQERVRQLGDLRRMLH